MMKKLQKIFTDYRLVEILILGMISGMPFSILYTTLTAWLKDSKIDIAVITTFSVAFMAYSLKIFWAPIVDNFKIPILSRFGHRKSWLILCSSSTSIILFAMSTVEPAISLSLLYFLAIALGISAATFDISVDALRIEKFDEESQALASSTAVLGYRLGMLITGAGALYLAEITKDNWSFTISIIGIIFIISTVFIITVRENTIQREKVNVLSFMAWLKIAFNPFKEFFTREYAIIILLAIIFFKLGDAMLAKVTMPFYMDLGYSKGQIAIIAKFYGLLSTLAGSMAGGLVIYYVGNFKGLIITGIAQSLTHIAFIWLNHQAPTNEALLIAISIENFAAAMGATALVGYISILCNKKYSATHYALLSSAASLCNNTVTMFTGSWVNMLGWDNFFILTIILALPGLSILIYLNKKIG